ncbi:MAG: M56 family metallopeptidase, partial [Pyrinomonadaceae bacterium]
MAHLDALLRDTLVQSLGWALLHSVWQCTLVALCYAGLRASLFRRPGAARARYAAACACMVLMLALPSTTFFILRQSSPAEGWSPTARPASSPNSNGMAAAQLVAAVPQLFADTSAEDGPADGATPLGLWAEDHLSRSLPWLVLLWFAGVLWSALRLAGGWAVAHRLALPARVSPAPVALRETFAWLARRLRVSRPVRLCVSAFVEVPTVVGWLRPVVLVPACALTGMSAAQLEAVLAHELAHVRRHDYLLNFLQAVAEAVLFYHPAVWWLARELRSEREHVCDDMAVAATGDALTFARALTTLEGLRRGVGSAAPALAANGGSLMHRIQRLVNVRQTPAPRRAPRAAGLAVALCALACALAWTSALASFNDPDVPAPPADEASSTNFAGGRKIAVTFVGLPDSQMWHQPRAERKTQQLLARLKAHRVPAVGFVTERDLYRKGDGQLR